MEIPTRKEVAGRILSAIFYRLWLYRKRHVMITLIQVIMPPLILFIFATVHSSVFTDKIVTENLTIYPLVSENELYASICSPSQMTIISYLVPPEYPLNFTETLQSFLRTNSLSCSNLELVQVESEDDMIKLAVLNHLSALSPPNISYVGGFVMYRNNTCNDRNAFPCLKFKIRMAKFIPSEISASDFSNQDDDKIESYFPMMGLQLLITKTFMEMLDPNYTKMKINVQPFPYPPHTKFISVLPMASNQLFLSISFVLGMTFIVYSVIRAPCSDKQSGFKVYLHLMGLPSWAFWLLWILNDVVVQCIAVSFQVILLFVDFNQDLGILVKQGDPVIWTLFLILYAMASITFCAFLASFFRRGVLATYICATIWLLSYYFADLYLPSSTISSSRYSKFGMCLVPNGALIWGVILMTSNAGGISWENISHRLESNGISLGEVLVMLTVDVIFYFILTLYTDVLRPGQRSPEKPWYFIFKRSCWSFTRERKFSVVDDGTLIADDTGNYVGRLEAAIKFENLTRHFRKQKALDGITMRIKEDKCTSIVGHNGSGKSSLLYLLCGGLSPTRGNAYVLGFSIITQMSIIKSFTSVCVQDNLLCEDMTVLEHLLLIAKLKGLNHAMARRDARSYLKKLDLLAKCNRFPNYLLEFEKRKLCVIMCMMGKSQIVLIDEPTSGLEDDMKRSVWDFILDFRNKTVLVMTSSIEEAYALGSRVAILAHGKVVALGSPQHLEDLFATGYHLKLLVPREMDPSRINSFVRTHVFTGGEIVDTDFRRMTKVMSGVDTDFDAASIQPGGISTGTITPGTTPSTQHLDEMISKPTNETLENTVLEIEGFDKPLVGIEQADDNQTRLTEELSIQLPKSEVPLFSNLFLLLENPNVLSYFGIIDWSLRLYAIDTAFKDANIYREWANIEPQEIRRTTDPTVSEEFCYRPDFERLSPVRTALNRFKALVYKRILWTYGTWLYVLVQFVVPVLLLLITIQGTNSSFHNRLERSEVDHSLSNFPAPVILYNEIENPNFLNYYEKVAPDVPYERIQTSFAERISQIKSDPEARLTGTYVAGVDINQTSATAMFSPTAFHAGPISLTLVLNAYIKFAFPNLTYNILSSSHPIESDTTELLKFYTSSKPDLESDETLTFAIMLGFGFFVFTSGFVLQPLAERTCGLRNLQLNTMLSKFSYWLSFLVCDLTLLMMLMVFILIILRTVPEHNAFKDIEFSKHFASIFLLAGYGAIVQSYVASFVFRQAKTCIYGMLSYNQVLGIFVFILGQCISDVPGYFFRIVMKFFLFPYSVPSGFFSLMTMTRVHTQCNLLSNVVKNAICDNNTFITGKGFSFDTSGLNKSCCDAHCKQSGHCKDFAMYFESEDLLALGQGLSVDALFLGLHSVLMTILLVLLELGIAQKFIEFRMDKEPEVYLADMVTDTNTSHIEGTGDSVTREMRDSLKRERHRMNEIKKSPPAERNLYFLIDSLSVNFHSRPTLTNILLVVEPGEILAIVGPSNSGKTVLMKVLVKLLSAKSGNVYYKGRALFHKNSVKFLKKIGYCPSQITHMYSKISGVKLMRLFGRLRGIPESKLESHVSKWLNLLGLSKRASGHFRFYTESMKRKLLLALALIGDPPVLLLDNPTENLDPLSKLQFWSVMKTISSNRSRIVILTTSRTDDLAENVGKMAILVNGSLECIFSPAEMLEKFGQGFTISIVLKRNPIKAGFDDYVNLKGIVEDDLHGILLQEEQYLLKYQVPKGEFKWSELFKITEDIKLEYGNIVEDYTIRETELEDVYLALAAKQQYFVRTKSTFDEFCIQYC